jgi:hypothetical protein
MCFAIENPELSKQMNNFLLAAVKGSKSISYDQEP